MMYYLAHAVPTHHAYTHFYSSILWKNVDDMDYTVQVAQSKTRTESATALYIDKKMNCKRTSTPNGSMDTHTS